MEWGDDVTCLCDFVNMNCPGLSPTQLHLWPFVWATRLDGNLGGVLPALSHACAPEWGFHKLCLPAAPCFREPSSVPCAKASCGQFWALWSGKGLDYGSACCLAGTDKEQEDNELSRREERGRGGKEKAPNLGLGSVGMSWQRSKPLPLPASPKTTLWSCPGDEGGKVGSSSSGSREKLFPSDSWKLLQNRWLGWTMRLHFQGTRGRSSWIGPKRQRLQDNPASKVPGIQRKGSHQQQQRSGTQTTTPRPTLHGSVSEFSRRRVCKTMAAKLKKNWLPLIS